MDGKQKTYEYEKIKEYILTNIEQQKYPDGKIESESKLTQLFLVSRMTVRQALLSLQQDGYIYTIPKKGSFVKSQESFKELDGLHSFSEDVKQLQGKQTTKVLLFQKETLPQHLDQKLKSHTVWHIIRIRYMNQIPIAYEDGYFDTDLIENITQQVLETSLYAYIEDQLHLKIDYATQDIEACIAHELGKYLDISSDAPLLKVSQTTYLQDQSCMEYCETFYRCDVYTFHQLAYRKK